MNTNEIKIGLDPIDESGAPIHGPLYVALDQLNLRKLAANEPFWESNYEGYLDLGFEGADRTTNTSLGWRKLRDMAFVGDYGRGRLLYAGDPGGLLHMHAQLMESDQNQVQFFKALVDRAGSLSSQFGKLPLYGLAAKAGAGLLTSVLKFMLATVDDDHELSYYGSLHNLGADGIKEGAYRLWKGLSKDDFDAAIDFSIRPLEPASPSVNVKTPVAVMLDGLDEGFLRDGRLDSGDAIQIEGAFGSGKTIRSFTFKQKYKNNKQPLGCRVAVHDAVLYRGPLGAGIPWHFSVKAVPRDVSREIAEIVTKAGALAAALIPDEEKGIEQATQFVLQTGQALAEMSKDVKLAGAVSGLIVHGSRVPEAQTIYPADLSVDAWTCYETPIKLAHDLSTTLRLKIRKLNDPSRG